MKCTVQFCGTYICMHASVHQQIVCMYMLMHVVLNYARWFMVFELIKLDVGWGGDNMMQWWVFKIQSCDDDRSTDTTVFFRFNLLDNVYIYCSRIYVSDDGSLCTRIQSLIEEEEIHSFQIISRKAAIP